MNHLDVTRKFSNCKAYQLLEQDLIKTFDYVEPVVQNSKTYSHRYYEIILRAGTEFENICKQILLENGFTEAQLEHTNIVDYFEVVKEFELFDYCFSSPLLNDWSTPGLTGSNVSPFMMWTGCNTYDDVQNNYKGANLEHWYQIYNSVKHNREKNFELANLENAIFSVVALGILLCSQYGMNAFDPYKEIAMYHTDDNGNDFLLQTIWKVAHPDSMPKNF